RRSFVVACWPLARYTPTRVGTTHPSSGGQYCKPVHPHARGDDVYHHRCAVDSNGTPPRAWGRLERSMTPGSVRLSTPISNWLSRIFGAIRLRTGGIL